MVNYPIFVLDDTPIVTAFHRFEEAVAQMEPPDLDNGLYRAYDRDGYRLSMTVSSTRHDANYTIIREENQPPVPEELRMHLRRTLGYFDISEEQAAVMSDDELVEYAATILAWKPSPSGCNVFAKRWLSIRRLFHKSE